VFNIIFHVYVVEPPPPMENADGKISRKISRHRKSTNVDGDDNGDQSDSEITVVDMRWSDWFREKHYFQVGNLIRKFLSFANLLASLSQKLN
jgi:hypothetical protein